LGGGIHLQIHNWGSVMHMKNIITLLELLRKFGAKSTLGKLVAVGPF
jgi:hypothetical protein